MKKAKKLQKPKERNWVAKALANPLFQGRSERDRTKYTRKVKHKGAF
jgi:stalled ribosome alternative rescue factor ArfA